MKNLAIALLMIVYMPIHASNLSSDEQSIASTLGKGSVIYNQFLQAVENYKSGNFEEAEKLKQAIYQNAFGANTMKAYEHLDALSKSNEVKLAAENLKANLERERTKEEEQARQAQENERQKLQRNAAEINCPPGTTYKERSVGGGEIWKSCLDSNGLEQGTLVIYRGYKAGQIEVKNGKWHGKSISWDMDGNVVEQDYYVGGKSVRKDQYPMARKKYDAEYSCNRGNETGCIELGNLFASEGNYSQAEKILTGSCKKGMNQACSAVSRLKAQRQQATLQQQRKAEADASRMRKLEEEHRAKMEKNKSTACLAVRAKEMYCINIANIERTKINIEREKKVAARSGYENKYTLHKNAEAQINYENLAEQERTKYKQLGGKEELKPETCQVSRIPAGAFMTAQQGDPFKKKIESEILQHCGTRHAQ